MDDICELLSTYNGRDKVVRLACYSLKLVGSLYKNEGLLRASSKLSATRATMRLFDDLPMLKYTLEYGLGKDEPDTISSVLGVFANVVDQLFFPLEKICWFGELGIIKLTEKQAENFDTANTVFWVTSLYVTLIRCLKQLRVTEKQRQYMDMTQNSEIKRQMSVKYIMETITCIKLCMDVVHAVNCLPRGWLWGGKMDGVQVGALATLSSLIGLGMYFGKKRFLK